MNALWRWLISFLVWLSADPQTVDLEAARAAAAASVARASMAVAAPAPAPPGPTPQACDCGQTCVRGVWKPDGRISQPCKCQCDRCKAERAKQSPACPDGKCPPSRVQSIQRVG